MNSQELVGIKDKLDMPMETIKRILKTKTFEECLEALKEALPDIWPKVYPNQLPDAVNRHIVAVCKQSTRDFYDPPADPCGIFRIPYK